MTYSVFRSRVKAVRRRLEGCDAASLVVTGPADVSYLTGFLGSDSWAVVTRGAVYLLTDGRYAEQARRECRGCRVVLRDGCLAESAAGLLNRLRTVSAAVEDGVSLGVYRLLKRLFKRSLKAAKPVVRPLRIRKDAAEVAAIRSAARIGAAAFRGALRRIGPGTTETEAAGVLECEIRRLGGAPPFETIVAFGSSASMPHHRPGRRSLKKNDFVLVDFGARFKGYCCDISRCFTVGSPSSPGSYRKVFDAVNRARRAAVAAIGPGVRVRDVDEAARSVIRAAGLPDYGHGTGHGLGLEVHEDPVIAAGRVGTLSEGMVLTVEPAVYVPGKLGIRLEDDVLVTGGGCVVLTEACPL
jgi:Xaa-Pro aminopeptidase